MMCMGVRNCGLSLRSWDFLSMLMGGFKWDAGGRGSCKIHVNNCLHTKSVRWNCAELLWLLLHWTNPEVVHCSSAKRGFSLVLLHFLTPFCSWSLLICCMIVTKQNNIFMLLFFRVRLLSDTEFEKKHMKPSCTSTPTSCPPYLFAVLTIRCTLSGWVALPFYF